MSTLAEKRDICEKRSNEVLRSFEKNEKIPEEVKKIFLKFIKIGYSLGRLDEITERKGSDLLPVGNLNI